MDDDGTIRATAAALTLELYLRPNGTILASLYTHPGCSEDAQRSDMASVWTEIYPAWDACRKVTRDLHTYIAHWVWINGGGAQQPPMF